MNIEEMKRIKIDRGYSNEQIAQLSGVPLSTVQKIFSGITKHPRYDTLQALEKVFHGEAATSHDQPNSGTWTYHASDTAASAAPQRNDGLSSVRESAFAYGSGDLRKKQGEYTLEDYYAIPDDTRVELIDGVIYDMAAPTFLHQQLVFEVSTRLKSYIQRNHGKCVVGIAPTDVRLDEDEKTMVQPDVFIVCDRSKIGPRHLEGAPDFIAEILSPSTSRKDHLIKLGKYASAGAREYWIIDPESKRIVAYNFDNDNIIPTIYTFSDKVPVAIFDGDCQIDFSEIYEAVKFLYEMEQ